MEILAQRPDESNYVWLIPVLRDGKPWKFIRRPEGSDTSQISISGKEAPARIIPINGRPVVFGGLN